MRAGASLILAMIEGMRVVTPDGSSGGGGGGSGANNDGGSSVAAAAAGTNVLVVSDIRNSVVRQCWRTVRLQTRLEQKLRSLTTFVKVSESVPEKAALDLPRIRAVFFNLLQNAVRRASLGGSVTWTVDYASSSRLLHSTVQYRGEPVPEAELQLLFPEKPRNSQQSACAGTPPRPMFAFQPGAQQAAVAGICAHTSLVPAASRRSTESCMRHLLCIACLCLLTRRCCC